MHQVHLQVDLLVCKYNSDIITVLHIEKKTVMGTQKGIQRQEVRGNLSKGYQ